MELPPAVVMEIAAMAASSPEARLERFECSMGYQVVRPGEAAWLPPADWLAMTICSTDGKRVRLVALAAVNPGQGSMRRLIAAIRAAGLEPVVVEPSGLLIAVLLRWGWRSRRVGQGFAAHNVWYAKKEPRVKRG